MKGIAVYCEIHVKPIVWAEGRVFPTLKQVVPSVIAAL
jgi:hypothetical protein